MIYVFFLFIQYFGKFLPKYWTNVRDVIYPFESIEALFPINEYIHRSGTQKLKVEFYPREGYEENGSENEKSIYLKHLEVRIYI